MTLAEFALTVFCVAAWAAAVPPARPARAAVRSIALNLFVMAIFDLILGMRRRISADWGEQDGNFSTPQNEWYATLECPSVEKLQRKPPGRMNLSFPGVTWLAQ